MSKQNKNRKIFWIVIILIFLIIGVGINNVQKSQNYEAPDSASSINDVKIAPVTEEDHLLGNPNADVIIVEYSDFQCPFCRDFHPTMKRLMSEYGREGNVAWVYRHFPNEDALKEISDADSGFDSLSKVAAVASECVAEIAGEDAFWDFTDAIFADLNSEFTATDLNDLAESLDVDPIAYDQCLASGKFEEKIAGHIEDGLKIYNYDPNFGTPYNIIITKTGTQVEIVGSQPYELIEQILQQHSFPNSL